MPGTVVCNQVPPGTLTAETFPDGSDTASDTGLTVTRETNRATTVTFETSRTGLSLINLKIGSSIVWSAWATLANSGTIHAYESRLEALAGQSSGLALKSDIPTPLDASATRAALGLAAADLDAQLIGIAIDADAVEQRLTAGRAGYLDNLSAGAVPTLAQILAGGDIDGFTLEQTLKLCLSALAGKLSGAAGTTITIRSADDTANRIVATVDSSGNRSAVTLNAAG